MNNQLSNHMLENGAYIYCYPPKSLWERDPFVDNLNYKWNNYSIYLHVPFCRNRCIFCTYESRRPQKSSFKDYIDILEKEISYTKESDNFLNASINSVYIGGGTASLLPNSLIEHIIWKLNELGTIEGNVDVTLECEPGTKNAVDFRILKGLGVNRLSIGVQALQDHYLKVFNRLHNVKDSLNMIQSAQKAGIENIQVDLIYGFPGHELDEWKKTINGILEYDISQISLYKLIVFPFEQLDQDLALKRLPPIPHYEIINEMQLWAWEKLHKCGFMRYSLSEFSKPGFESKYAIYRWSGEDCLGLGPSALSRNGLSLYENEMLFHRYSRKIDNIKRPIGKSIKMFPIDAIIRDIVLGFYLLNVNLKVVEERIGISIGKEIEIELIKLIDEAFIVRKDDNIHLTQKGIISAAHVMRSITNIATSILYDKPCVYSTNLI